MEFGAGSEEGQLVVRDSCDGTKFSLFWSPLGRAGFFKIPSLAGLAIRISLLSFPPLVKLRSLSCRYLGEN